MRPSRNWGDGINCQADDDGAGFAHEIPEFSGSWHMTGVVGLDGQFKLKFTPIVWTADALALRRTPRWKQNPSPNLTDFVHAVQSGGICVITSAFSGFSYRFTFHIFP